MQNIDKFNTTTILDSSDKIGNCEGTISNPTLFQFAKGWQSIPETMILNLILFISFLLIFITFRRLAWNRNHVHIRRTSKGWLQSIYGDRKLVTKHLIKRDFSNIPSNIQATIAEVGYKLSDVLLITDKDIRENRGNDAYQYLLFQKYIIYFLTILTAFCMLVILPINMFCGESFDSPPLDNFVSTTIINLKNESLYWVHVVGASVMSLIGIYMMNRFTSTIQLDDEKITRRTLLIRRVPKSKCDKELLANYFRTSISNCVIEGIQLIYNVRRLVPMTNELTNLVNARCYCLEYLELKGKRLQIRPACFGEFGCLCSCCKYCRKVDGIKYYSKKEEEVQALIESEWKESVLHPTGGFFITFRTEKMAQEAFIHLKHKQERAFSFCPFSETFAQVLTGMRKLLKLPVTDELQVSRWIISYAPYPDDINWCDITVDFKSQWIRSILLNLLLLIIFVFFSTPTVILQNAEGLKSIDFAWFKRFLPAGQKVPDLISPLILIIAASALPAIVTLACQYIAYVNMSGKNHAIMWKVYLFLILMVIIWPPLGMTSVSAIIFSIIEERNLNPAQGIHWECLFPVSVNVGAFFVNYTIQSAFIGNIMELMRIPELLVYLYYRITSRSKAEVDTASRYVVWDFGIGIRYPRFLLIFAMVVTYSLSCPLISAAGLVYMVIKHFIDRYNIYYVYNPSKINSKIHSTAIIFVHIAFLMMQFQLLILTSVKAGYTPVNAASLFVLIVSLLIFSGHFFFYLFRNINHLTYRATRKQAETSREYCACSYLPPVLYDLAPYVPQIRTLLSTVCAEST